MEKRDVFILLGFILAVIIAFSIGYGMGIKKGISLTVDIGYNFLEIKGIDLGVDVAQMEDLVYTYRNQINSCIKKIGVPDNNYSGWQENY